MKTRRPPSPAKLTKMVDDFNARFPVGTAVDVRRDDGRWTPTRVQDAAFVLGGHSAVAFFDDISGCFSIDGRVRATVQPEVNDEQ